MRYGLGYVKFWWHWIVSLLVNSIPFIQLELFDWTCVLSEAYC